MRMSKTPLRGAPEGFLRTNMPFFFLRHMILKRDLPFDNFRYMLSNHNFFQTLRNFYEDRKFYEFYYFHSFLVFHFLPKHQQLHFLSMKFILHQICKKIHLQNWTKITKHITIQYSRPPPRTDVFRAFFSTLPSVLNDEDFSFIIFL